MKIELIHVGKPVSVNRTGSKRGGRSRDDFRTALRLTAQTYAGGSSPLEGELYARIIWFHRNQPGDPDNIIKPILDALEGICYTDDQYFVKVAAERVNILGNFLFAEQARTEIADRLLDLIARKREHILYIEIGIVQDRVIVFGPVL